MTTVRVATNVDLPAHLLARIAAVSPAVRVTGADGIGEAEVLLFGWRTLTPELLRSAPGLRWLHSISAGVDPVLPELTESPVLLTATRGIHAGTMADHTYMLLLAVARGLGADLRNQVQARWQPHGVRPLQGMHMGVVGTGSIGVEIIRRAPAFDMVPYSFNRSGTQVSGAARTLPLAALNQHLPLLDCLVLVCPLTPQTEGIIGERELALMKPGALLINAGRGELVDEPALIRALQSGRLGGAGLDVTAVEPLPAQSPLWQMENVVITPHVGGKRPDYQEAAVAVFCDNLERYVSGRPLLHLVDKRLGY